MTRASEEFGVDIEANDTTFETELKLFDYHFEPKSNEIMFRNVALLSTRGRDTSRETSRSVRL